MTEGMRNFANRYQFSLSDPDLRRMYEYELSALRDQASREEYAKETGRAEGIAQAIHGMLHNGLPIDMIYKCAGAPRSEVDAVIAEIRAGE